jgi:hypothetical protein
MSDGAHSRGSVRSFGCRFGLTAARRPRHESGSETAARRERRVGQRRRPERLRPALLVVAGRTAGFCLRTTRSRPPLPGGRLVMRPRCVRASTAANVDRNMDRNAVGRRARSAVTGSRRQSRGSYPGHPESDFACSTRLFVRPIVRICRRFQRCVRMPEEGLEPPTRGL